MVCTMQTGLEALKQLYCDYVYTYVRMCTDFWVYVNDATMKGIVTSSCCPRINIPKYHRGQSLFKCLCDLSSRTVEELPTQDEEVLLERNYLERAAAIDEYCSYHDLLDQSQSGKLFHLHTYVCMPTHYCRCSP